MRPALALAVAALLVTAGCGATVQSDDATTTDTPRTTATTTATTTAAETTTQSSGTTADGTTERPDRSGPDLGIEVMNGELAYDPNRTYARVQSMLGTDQSAPGAVMVIEGLSAAGEASNTGRVYLDTDDEAVLAHEFVHSIMLRASPKPAVGSPDQAFAVNSLVEGAAEYVEVAYARRYLDREGSYFRRLPRDPGEAYFLGRYYFGYRYFEARANGTGDVVEFHETPPNTSEQVIHGYDPTVEPPRDLSVLPADRHIAGNATWRYGGAARLGEVTTLLTLRTRLRSTAARHAAAGWGNDRLVTFERDGETGFVWVHRWDDEANATQFAEAFAAYREEPAPDFAPPEEDRQTPDAAFTRLVWTDAGASFGFRRLDPETTVVRVGSESFVEAASASVENGTVTVEVDGSSP